MCTKQNIGLLFKALSPVRYIASGYLFVAGCVIAANVHLAQAFGRGMTAVGASLLVCSLWNAGMTALMQAGVKRRNKFILLSAMFIDLVLTSVQVTLGSTMYSKTVTKFSQSLQLDCLLKTPITHTLEECLEFTLSDRYAAMMLVWRSYSYLSLEYTKYYQRLVTIEQDGVCCGFGPPMRCTGDARDFPSWSSRSKVGSSTDKRYVCGAEDGWYDENYFCSQYVDDTAVSPEIGGCKYDYPIGDCMDIDEDISLTVRGCAAELEAHIANKILFHALTVIGLSAVTLTSMLSGCCMFWKRSYEDSVPDHVERHIPWDPFKERELRQARSDGETVKGSGVRLDPLGKLIMGDMPESPHRKIMPL